MRVKLMLFNYFSDSREKRFAHHVKQAHAELLLENWLTLEMPGFSCGQLTSSTLLVISKFVSFSLDDAALPFSQFSLTSLSMQINGFILTAHMPGVIHYNSFPNWLSQEQIDQMLGWPLLQGRMRRSSNSFLEAGFLPNPNNSSCQEY